MKEDRLAKTLREPNRCPACDGAVLRRGVCPACGHSLASEVPFSVPALRRHSFARSRPWYDNPFYFGIGLLFLTVVAFFAYASLIILISFAVLFLPAMIRTIRLTFRPAAHEIRLLWAYILGSIVASFGVAFLAGAASAVAFCCVMLAIPGGNSISAPTSVYVWSLMVAVVVFLGLFVVMWPRKRSADSFERPPDPEN